MNKKMLIVGLMFAFASSGDLCAIIKKAGKVARNSASTTGEALGSTTAQKVYLGVGTLGIANLTQSHFMIANKIAAGNHHFGKGNYSLAVRFYMTAIAFIQQNGGSPAEQPSEQWLWNRVERCITLSEKALDRLKAHIQGGCKSIAIKSIKQYMDNRAGKMCYRLGIKNQEANPTLAEKYFTAAQSLGYSKSRPKLTAPVASSSTESTL